MKLSPYVAFKGNCEEVIAFYTDVLGGEVKQMMRYKEAPPEAFEVTEAMENLIMHCTIEFRGQTLMVSDNMTPHMTPGNNMSLSINTDEEAAYTMFHSLLEGGQQIMPFADAFWGGKFGMLIDKFGIQWMFTAGHDGA
ncbi:MAG: glyoxalase/bleomycin resistance/extradiol dioxygenase family protein [Flavobacteriaceae bacterium]|nr:glyoxalase/bleomycin resistance/extradiol dioxygenase family protein [Flavobacteriaceae bacterium]